MPAFAATIPDCAGPVEIGGAKVTRVEQNGDLILADGRAVVLEGVRLAHVAPDGPVVTDQALAVLRDMTRGSVTFTAMPPKEDRYDRIRAQVFSRDGWLQTKLLEAGLARVAIAPDRNECSSELYAAEARSRGQNAGQWGSGNFQVRVPQQMMGTSGTYQIVEGLVRNVNSAPGRAFIDFSTDWSQGFSATIAPEDRAAFRGFNLDSLVAKHVRLRGMVQDYRGRPEMALSNPAQIEVLN